MNPHWRPWKVIPGKITGVTSVGDSQNFSFQVFHANVCPKCHSAVAKYKIAIKNNLFYFATLIFLGYNTSICSNCELSISLLFKEYFCDTKKDYFWVASSICFQNKDRHEIFDIKKNYHYNISMRLIFLHERFCTCMTSFENLMYFHETCLKEACPDLSGKLCLVHFIVIFMSWVL